MPFERYLRTTDDRPDHAYYYDGHHAQHPDNAHPHAVHFQIPQYMLNGPPVLAPGGGAEVLPAGLLGGSSGSFASSWFANNGFAPFQSALISRHAASSSAIDPCDPPRESPRLPASFLPNFLPGVDSQRQSSDGATSYLPNTAPALSSGSFNSNSYSLSNALVPEPTSSLSTPSALGLPVYSASGFDLLSILSRVVNRPNPTVQLGPVDFSCSFVIVDVRRFDSPIVYASPTFCHLTGYSEQEVLGRNCRFLQSPTGHLARAEPRRFSSPEAINHMRKSLASSKECQTTLINYRKGGHAFINLVTVIPLRGGANNAPEEAEEVVYHIGFQVDLTEQPSRILDKLRDGSYHHGAWGTGSVASSAGLPSIGRLPHTHNVGTKGGRHGQMMSIAVSKELKNLFANPKFTDAVPISTGTNAPGPTSGLGGTTEQSSNATTPLTMLVTPPSGSASMNRMSVSGHTTARSTPVSLTPSLSLLLLEFLPDFLLVLSLKGAFLYVAPSVRLVLGYEPEELVGRSISDVCHPADLVPLMRELKEGSVSGVGDAGPSTASSHVPKSVDLLFRALPKSSGFLLPPQTNAAEQSDAQHLKLSSGSGSQSSPPSGGDSSDGTPPPPYVWLECRGRLHVEPGKGRKAIILSGRARWMPVVRWGGVDKAGGLGSGRHPDPRVRRSGPSVGETSESGAPSIDPLEFWASLSPQGTFLVASASVRDVLGWGTGEVIGRSIWEIVRDGRSGLRERVEAELTKLDALETSDTSDPPPMVVTTSLVHRLRHVIPVKLAFYRTPRSRQHTPPSTSTDAAPTPLIHPLNNPLCPIVCQATVLSNTDHPSRNGVDSMSDPRPRLRPRRGKARVDAEDNTDEFHTHASDASLFEELEITRGSSWQYELQQLKFANQRLQEAVQALEVSSGAGPGPPSSTISTASVSSLVFGPPSSPPSSNIAMPVPQQPPLAARMHYAPLMPSPLLPPLQPPNSLHALDPPSSEWSSLAGANGQGTNPLKRGWHSENGPTT